MSTNTLLIGAAVVAAVVYFRSQQGAGGVTQPHLGATPAPAAPGFGFNLGFFKND